MLDRDFLEFLEYKISRVLDNIGNGFWCDGVLLSGPDDYYSPKRVNDTREVRLIVFTGKDGQAKYELVLRFGDKSTSRYVRNLDIKECWPENDKEDWFDLDIENARMAIQLD